MKILIVSMRSIHTIRWVSQLKHSGHEVFYFDILNGGYIKEWDWVTQHTNWRYKFGSFKGRYFIKKQFPKLHHLLENNVEMEFKKILTKYKPDVVHSFALNISGIALTGVIKNYKNKWILSTWGSDLFYLTIEPEYKKECIKALSKIDYLFTDCIRDFKIAYELGFRGQHLGVFPGGGGYDFNKYNEFVRPIEERNIILIKGFHGELGRAIQVIEALELLVDELKKIEVVIFGADNEVINYIKLNKKQENLNIKVFVKISHEEVIHLMGMTLIYIGNSISDGLPNTLLEAICFGAFPIQSNPGGVSAEIIKDRINGFLIDDCEDVLEIKMKIEQALHNEKLVKDAFIYNMELRKQLEFEYIKEKVLEKYKLIENNI